MPLHQRGFVGILALVIVVAIIAYLYVIHSPLVPPIPGMGTTTPSDLSDNLNAAVKASATQKNADRRSAEINAELSQ